MPAPKIFISATSHDLASVRQVVKEALLTIGCHPVEQTNFPPDWRDVQNMLRERIAACQALIHIAGLRYGAEPDPATLPEGTPRRSYTQFEYDIGREFQRKSGDKRFRVYTFVCPEDFPYDAAAPETDEQRALQRKHRDALLEGAALYETPKGMDAVEKRILALREEVLTLRTAESRRAQLTLAGVALIVSALAGIGYWQYRSDKALPSETAKEVTQQLDAELVATRLREEIDSRYQREAEADRAAGKNWEAIRELERRRDAALARVDDIVRIIKEGLAGDPSPIFTEATRILEKEGVDAAIAYLDSHKTDQLARAERAAAQLKAAQETLERELRPLLLQAKLHETRRELHKARALLEKVADTAPQWSEARRLLGGILFDLGRYADAETHTRSAVDLSRSPDERASALSNLALILKDTNRVKDAELRMRQALEIFESNYGPEDIRVASVRNNLAILLVQINRAHEALPLMRQALSSYQKNYGPNDPKVATYLINLSAVLIALSPDNSDEAELYVRRAIEIDKAKYGPEHPIIARDLVIKAALMHAQNQFEEGEIVTRRIFDILQASPIRGYHEQKIWDAALYYYRQFLAAQGLDPAEIHLIINDLVRSAKTGPDHD